MLKRPPAKRDVCSNPKSKLSGCQVFPAVVWDIETYQLRANEGFIMASAIKPLGLPPIVHWNKNLGKNSMDDRELCLEIRDTLEQAELVFTFYGLGFDFKMLNSRLLFHIERPLSPRLHIDLYRLVRSTINTSRRSLAVVTAFFGIKGKTHVDMEKWLELAFLGSGKALAEVIDHMKKDVEITEKLIPILRHSVKSISRA